MQLARIVGSIVTTIAHPSLKGWRMLLCQPITEAGKDTDAPPIIALDNLGAGIHAKVFYTTDGSAAQEIIGDSKSPVRNSIMGLVDDSQSTEANR